MASDGWAAKSAEVFTNLGRWGGNVHVDGAQGVNGDAEMEPTPSGGASGNGGKASDRGGAEAGGLDVLRRFLRQVGNVNEYIIDGGTWDCFVGYTQGLFAYCVLFM